MKILFLSSSEYGDIISGVGVIVTNTLRCLASIPYVESALGIFRPLDLFKADVLPDNLPRSLPPVKKIFTITGEPLNKLHMLRGLVQISSNEEKHFLRSVEEVSKNYDVAIWFGNGYDPVNVKLPSRCNCPILFHITDSLSLYQRMQITKRFKNLRTWMAEKYEGRILASGYARVVYVAQADCDIGISLSTPQNSAKVICLPNGVDLKAFCPGSPLKSGSGKIVMLFTGVMFYQPNVDAALYLIREIMPNVHGDIELRIVGRAPTGEILEAAKADARIVVTGTVQDMTVEHQAADIFIAPMISGSGIKNKILQAMACGLPVITTPACVRAFPETPAGVLVGDNAEQMVTIIERLIGSEVERSQLGRDGRAFIEKNWSWEQRTEKLVKICADVKEGVL